MKPQGKTPLLLVIFHDTQITSPSHPMKNSHFHWLNQNSYPLDIHCWYPLYIPWYPNIPNGHRTSALRRHHWGTGMSLAWLPKWIRTLGAAQWFTKNVRFHRKKWGKSLEKAQELWVFQFPQWNSHYITMENHHFQWEKPLFLLNSHC